MEQQIIEFINNVVAGYSNVGPLLGSLLIVLESIIPFLPLSVFIALNVLSFGFIYGFLLSYFSTVLGCSIAFVLTRKVFHKPIHQRIKEDSKAYHFFRAITKLKFSSLVLIIAMPFTPAFLVNICGALSNLSFKKFLAGLLVGKFAIVFFWGFVGDSLIESITNPVVMAELIMLLVTTYIVSKIIDKKYGIE